MEIVRGGPTTGGLFMIFRLPGSFDMFFESSRCGCRDGTCGEI